MFKKTRLFKKYDYPDYSIIPNHNADNKDFISIHKLTPATSWPDYITQVVKCSREGTGYKIERYKFGELEIDELFWQTNQPGNNIPWRKVNQTQGINIKANTTHNFNTNTVVWQKV